MEEIISSNQDVHRRHYIESQTTTPTTKQHQSLPIDRVVTPIDMQIHRHNDDEEEEESENGYVSGKRYYVDENEPYAVQQNTKQFLQQKTRKKADSYAQHIFDHQQNDSAAMDDIVRQMDVSHNDHQDEEEEDDDDYYDEYDY